LRFAESSAASMIILFVTMLLTAVFLRTARYFEVRH
jgi:ABC-type sugar transport system permease subunit